MHRKIFFTVLLIFCPCIGAAAEPACEPFTCRFDFEDRLLHAWSSYPLWQDTAYDDNFTVGSIAPGDPNLSLVQLVNTYEPGDSYAGAQKKLDFFLSPGFRLTADYFLKTHLPAESITVRIAAGPLGKLDYSIPGPKTNRWERLTITYEDIITRNPQAAAHNPLQAYGLAFLVKIPHADPAMPFYLGLDNITLHAFREPEFRFAQPEMVKLPEWKPKIARKLLHRGEPFTLQGEWPFDADRVQVKPP
jgi:hypothetical protein